MRTRLVWKQRQVLAVTLVSYAGYYLCRLNFGQVQSIIGAELGLSALVLGKILLAHQVAYVVGQVVNGVLCDRVGSRVLAVTGAFGSAAVCLVFPWLRTPTSLVVIWGINGFFQSMGFSPCIRALAHWFEPSRRGRVNGIFSLSFQIGNMCAWLLAGWMASLFGWRFAFLVPAGMLAAVGVMDLFLLLDSPEEAGVSLAAGHEDVLDDDGCKPGAGVLGSGRVWAAGLSSSFVSVAVYGLMFWLPNYLQVKVGEGGQVESAIRATLFPIAGCFGALAAGWISDHWFKDGRMPVIAGFAAAGGVLLGAFAWIDPTGHAALNALALALAAFFLMGSHVHTVGSLSMDFGGRRGAGSATGIINALSNLGGLVASIGVGFVVDHPRMGWSWVFPLCALSCLLGSALLGLVWRQTRRV